MHIHDQKDSPQWFQGLKLAERYLDITDNSNRFWNNIQQPGVDTSQSVLVARDLVLAYMMLQSGFDSPSGSTGSRFTWLLQGTKASVHQIHGGCGFSRMLLYRISQINSLTETFYLRKKSTRLATIILLHLYKMRQWHESYEEVWQEQPIKWISKIPPESVAQTPKQMVAVIAEAWRFTAIIYILFRFFRYVFLHACH